MSKEFKKRDVYPSPKKSFMFTLKPLSEIKNDCLYVLDANVLLLPYTTGVKSLDAIKDVYLRLVGSNKIFIPSQVIREYLDNRSNKLSNINESLSKKSNQNFNYVDKYPLLESLPEYQDILEQEKLLKEAIKEHQNRIRKTMGAVQAWGWNDPVSKMYHEVLSERVLDDSALNLDDISKDLERRNELNIPPGYKDKSKDENQAGDLLIWHELLELGKTQSQHVVFVSGDEKADWWHQSGKKPLYPRFELVDEFREVTDGKSFHILSLSGLLELFEADIEVVETVKSSEEEVKGQATHKLDFSKPPKKPTTIQASEEYRKHLNIPENHRLIERSSKWKVKGGYDTDTYELVEIDENDSQVAKYVLYDSTKTEPPFTRELYAEKI